jgi:hypothetical protein
MLSRFSQVQPDGTYVPPPPANAKASYATMVSGRVACNVGCFMKRLLACFAVVG